jgi:hypothetical protein
MEILELCLEERLKIVGRLRDVCVAMYAAKIIDLSIINSPYFLSLSQTIYLISTVQLMVDPYNLSITKSAR